MKLNVINAVSGHNLQYTASLVYRWYWAWIWCLLIYKKLSELYCIYDDDDDDDIVFE